MAADGAFRDLGEEVKFTDETSAAELTRVVGTQRAAILELQDRIRAGERTDAEREEKLARMGEDLRAANSKVRLGSGVVWQPGGSASDVLARFVRADGLIQIGDGTRRVRTPNGWTDIKVPGLLTDRAPATREHADLVTAFFGYSMARYLSVKGITSASERATEIWSSNVVPAMLRMPGAIGDFFHRALGSDTEFERAFNATAGTGGELISNPTLGTALRTPRTLPRLIPTLVPMQRATSKTFTAPVMTGRGLLRLQGAVADDPARATPQTAVTSSAAVTMKDFIVNSLVQSTFFRDIASTGLDGVMLLMRWLDQAVLDSEEMILLHGDTAATHQDTISTWTVGSYFTSGQLDGTDSPIKAILGVRARAADDSNTTAGGGTFDAADHFGTLALMGTWGAGAVMMVGINGLYTLLANSLFTTVDKFGDRATLVTGQLGQVGNTPVTVSEFLPKEFDTSSGLRTGSNNGNVAVYANPQAMTMWDMEPADGGEYDVSEPHKGARYLGRTATRQLTFNVPSGDKPCAFIYNLG